MTAHWGREVCPADQLSRYAVWKSALQKQTTARTRRRTNEETTRRLKWWMSTVELWLNWLFSAANYCFSTFEGTEWFVLSWGSTEWVWRRVRLFEKRKFCEFQSRTEVFEHVHANSAHSWEKFFFCGVLCKSIKLKKLIIVFDSSCHWLNSHELHSINSNAVFWLKIAFQCEN